jgi:hypothetical protein
MAEHVQQSLESMISELEQMQRVQLLDADEVRWDFRKYHSCSFFGNIALSI